MFLTTQRGYTEGASLDQVFDQFLNGSSLFSAPQTSIKTDITKTDSGYELVSELPGVAKKDIQVSFEKDILTLKVQASEQTQTKSEGYMLKERSGSEKSRAFRLPDADPDSVEANLDNGLLTIKVSQRPETKARHISIN